MNKRITNETVCVGEEAFEFVNERITNE